VEPISLPGMAIAGSAYLGAWMLSQGTSVTDPHLNYTSGKPNTAVRPPGTINFREKLPRCGKLKPTL